LKIFLERRIDLRGKKLIDIDPGARFRMRGGGTLQKRVFFSYCSFKKKEKEKNIIFFVKVIFFSFFDDFCLTVWPQRAKEPVYWKLFPPTLPPHLTHGIEK